MNNVFFKYKRFLILIILAACNSDIFAQSVLNFDATSPGVGSLLRVQDVSANLYTGRPNISVPLYSIALKNFSYDIQLLYNAEGNKPDLPVGNVGLGWSITGGQIYRIANGYPDEIYTFSQYLDRTEMQDWNQEANLYRYYDSSGSNEDYFMEPDMDEFIINIGRINASFYMYKGRDGKMKTKISSQNSPYFEVKNVRITTPESPLSPIPFAETEIYNPYLKKTFHPKVSIAPRPVLITEITIVDSDGVTYVFGGNINSIDFSCQYRQDTDYGIYYDKYGRQKVEHDEFGNPIGSLNVSWEDFHSDLFATPSTWHINKIILPNKEYIDFNYSKSNVNIMERLNLYESSSAFGLNPIHSSTINTPILPLGVNPQYYLLEDKTYDIIYPSLLEGIRASNGDFVNFTSSRRNDLPTDGYYDQQELFLWDNYGGAIGGVKDKCYSFKLDEMRAKNGVVNFYYTNEPDRRLKLDSLKMNRNEVYKFQYNPRLLPPYSETLTDNWGYYNGKNYYEQQHQLYFEKLYAFRQPDSIYVKAEILEKMTYPTGGEVFFQYELHSYSQIATQYPFEIKTENGVAGGVRIKKIIYSDKNNPLASKTKEFLYLNEDGTSSGILSVVPRYTASGKGRFDYDGNGINMHGSYSYSKKSDTHINWVDQFHMGYSRVTELLSDGSKTVYSFVNHDQVKDEPSAGDLAFGMTGDLHHKYTSRRLDRGLLESVKSYGASNKLLKQEIFEYHLDLSDYIKSINRYSFMGVQPRRVSANKIYTYFPFLQKKETTLYTEHNSINETEEYEYNKYRLLTSTKKYTNHPNDNSTIETSTKHLSDLMEEYDRNVSTPIPSGSPLKVYDTMRSQGMLSYPIESVEKRNGKVTSSEVMTYKMSDRYVVQDKQYKLESDAPLDNYSSFKLLNSVQCAMDERCAVEMEYLDFDSYGNPTNVVDKTGTKTAYIWGYNGLYPVAKVVNARNTFKSIPQYRDVWTSESANLKYNRLSENTKTYTFYTRKAGNVEIVLVGALGYNWYVTGDLDGNKTFNLVQVRSSDDVGRPWTDYQNAYTYGATYYVPAGSHTLSIGCTSAYKEESAGTWDGTIYFSYWTQEPIAPETSGTDDIFYKNFEDTYSRPASFGYHSSSSYIGSYSVTMVTNPEREYVIDYQIFKDGRWNYTKHDFVNGCDTIDEGMNPIDDVRVYPKDASITTYSYFPLIGLRSKTNERGVSESYKYNDFGKLLSVMDNDMNFVEKYDYYYQGQTSESEVTYYNEESSKTFTRNTCDASLGENGESIDYVVPAKKYSSLISREDANQKAYIDLMSNGQEYANEHAECNSNIIVSVYNPTGMDHLLTFDWGTQGNLTADYYDIPPSRLIAETGDILKDYEPTKIYVPRRYYRNVQVALLEDPWNYLDLSIKSVSYNCDINYYLDSYTDFEDIYVIGGYPFTY